MPALAVEPRASWRKCLEPALIARMRRALLLAAAAGPNSRDQLIRFGAPDVPAALVHYYFGAQAGDYVAQMILGYRHLQVRHWYCRLWGTAPQGRVLSGTGGDCCSPARLGPGEGALGECRWLARVKCFYLARIRCADCADCVAQGLGVPKSCHAAVLYYKPVAERVLAMAQAGCPVSVSWASYCCGAWHCRPACVAPGGVCCGSGFCRNRHASKLASSLAPSKRICVCVWPPLLQEREGMPQVRQLRLSHKTAHARQRSTEQEVRTLSLPLSPSLCLSCDAPFFWPGSIVTLCLRAQSSGLEAPA